MVPYPHSRRVRGSSPRVRGKPRRRPRGRQPPGLIPARAGKTTWGSQCRKVGPAHPRACGENDPPAVHAARPEGSSPRVRGKLAKVLCCVTHPGLIPARAGKTRLREALAPVAGAHPRACGENLNTRDGDRTSSGSSPRVRGKRHQSSGKQGSGRLIPARAGKTSYSHPPTLGHSAHPRACGENVDEVGRVWIGGGSSPRVRGKRGGWRRPPRKRRLIPARAGKTPLEHWNHAWGRAHPRACGENAMTSPSPDSLPGSSPRVRGKRAHYNVDVNGTGLIPARAGKTSWMETPLPQRRAHPRACGENIIPFVVDGRLNGSSPRVRGKLEHARRRPDLQRLIPARAGKTSPKQRQARQRPAHPRACGENLVLAPTDLGPLGSSPRVRGKRG